MPQEPFLLVSLNEEKAKKLAQVISNDTCTKILNHFAQGKDGTETEIAKALSLPLSTVHYNLKQLVDAKLVMADEYHYSSKGREVLHYKLANRYIIIAPQEERETFMKKLKGILPALFITLGIAAVFKIFSDLFVRKASSAVAAELTMKAFDAAPVVMDAVEEGARGFGAAPMAVAAPSHAAPLITNDAMLFFIAGAVFIFIILAISAYVNRKK